MLANTSFALLGTFLLSAFIFTFSPAAQINETPTVIAHAQSFISVEAGEYTLMGVSITLAPGEYVGQHSHRGPDLITVFEGEVINHKEGSDQSITTGESWLDLPGEMHAVTNASDSIARLWASALLPKGDTTLSPSAQFPLNVEAGEYALISFVLDFAPGAEMSEHSHGGYVVSYILEGEVTLRESGVSKELKAFQSWAEVPDVTYSVTNVSENNTRIATSILLPAVAAETAFVSSPAAPAAETPQATDTVDTAESAPNSNSQFMFVLISAGLLLIILAAGYYLRRRAL